MNATDYTAAPVNASPIQPEAFLSYDCRPTWRWVACGPNYKYSIQIFYWVFCAVHTVSCLVAMGYTIWSFCACSSKPVPRSNRKLTLRVFTSFSVLAFGCAAIYCFFMTSPVAYGLPPYIVCLFWTLAVDSCGCCGALVVCTWADALWDKDIAVKSSFLAVHKKYFWGVVIERLINCLIMCFAAADLNSSYLALYRLYLVQWTVYGILLGIAVAFYGLKMRRRLLKAGAMGAASRTLRITAIYFFACMVAFTFTGVHAGVLYIHETEPIAWFILMCGYHVNIVVMATWFLLARPNRNDLTKGQSAVTRGHSRSIQSGSVRSIAQKRMSVSDTKSLDSSET